MTHYNLMDDEELLHHIATQKLPPLVVELATRLRAALDLVDELWSTHHSEQANNGRQS